jgi:hypothetical protein
VSKSGTSRFSRQSATSFQSDNMSAGSNNGSASRYEQNRSWTTATSAARS